MRWPWPHRRSAPSADAQAAVTQAHRALQDTDRLADHIGEVTDRASKVAARADEVRRQNHIAEAVVDAITRRARHP